MAKGTGSPVPPSRLRAIGRALRDARGDRTQAEFGLLLGAPQTTVSRWELGAVDFGVEQLRAFEEALGLEPGHLVKAGGYIPGQGMPGAPIRAIGTDDLDEVVDLLRAADSLDLGAKVTNRSTVFAPGVDTVEWTVEIHERMPGAGA